MSVVESDLGLTPVLQNYADGLRKFPDDKLRYQQLLFLAAKLKPMDTSLKTPENKVPGCMSTVHVHARLEDGKIFYDGDSDAQLTKGLVAMLVNGLSNHTAQEIEGVKPEFIKYAGIQSSLTPGRNNGFLNMLNLMKIKAKELSVISAPKCFSVSQSISQKLQLLKPEQLTVEDESSKHAGHSGTQGLRSQETHFNVKIIASCFDGLSLVQRHKMVYTLLAQELKDGVHALSIYAKTPVEEANK